MQCAGLQYTLNLFSSCTAVEPDFDGGDAEVKGQMIIVVVIAKCEQKLDAARERLFEAADAHVGPQMIVAKFGRKSKACKAARAAFTCHPCSCKGFRQGLFPCGGEELAGVL